MHAEKKEGKIIYSDKRSLHLVENGDKKVVCAGAGKRQRNRMKKFSQFLQIRHLHQGVHTPFEY